jgi:hypothetical protein
LKVEPVTGPRQAKVEATLRLDRQGIPVLTAPADRLLGLIGWEGRAWVAHLMTEFFDPWEHFYDHNRTNDHRQLLPTGYRLKELADAMRGVHGLDGEEALAWTDLWLAERLLRMRPPLEVLTALVRQVLDDEVEDPATFAGHSLTGTTRPDSPECFMNFHRNCFPRRNSLGACRHSFGGPMDG